MAGTMIHLLTAEKLLPKLTARQAHYPFDASLKIEEDYFIAGNICPDGIMAREGYQRGMKLHTHFRDGIPDGDFDKPGMVPLFERRLREFWEMHRVISWLHHPYDDGQTFYSGGASEIF